MDVLFEGLWAPTMEDAGSENKYNRRLDIQLVIKNELSSPFTYQEFHSFLKTLHSEENLEFLNQILKYQKLASPFFPVSIHKRERAASRGRSNSSLPPLLPEKEHSPTDSAMDPHSPVSPKGVTPEVFQNSMENVRQAAQKLVNSYLTIGQGAEVNVPSRIRDPLLAHLSKGNLHPELFKDAYDHISTVLRQGPFAQFLANAQNAPIVPHEDDVPRVSLQQIVDRETLAPYAYQDYLEFLKIDHQEESLEFLDTVMKYRRQTLPYFPDAVLFRMKTLNINARPISMIINRKLSVKSVDGESPVEIDKTEFTPSIKPNSVSDEEWVQIKSKISDSFSEMVETFVVPGAVKEVNLPVRVRKTIEECYRQHVTHPHVFTKAYEHIYNMLRENTLQKFLKKTYFESPNAPALLELPKVTMKNLILNELKSPYGNQEFYIFLKGEHCAENLEFLSEIVQYHKKASVVFPDHMPEQRRMSRRNSRLSDNEDTPTIQLPDMDENERVRPTKPAAMDDDAFQALMVDLNSKAKHIMDTFCYTDSPKQVMLTHKERHTLSRYRDAEVLHPEIFKHAFEHIALILQQNHLRKFIRWAMEQPNGTAPMPVDGTITLQHARRRTTSKKNG